MPFVTMWVDLEGIMLCDQEVRLSLPQGCFVLLLVVIAVAHLVEFLNQSSKNCIFVKCATNIRIQLPLLLFIRI